VARPLGRAVPATVPAALRAVGCEPAVRLAPHLRPPGRQPDVDAEDIDEALDVLNRGVPEVAGRLAEQQQVLALPTGTAKECTKLTWRHRDRVTAVQHHPEATVG